MTETLPAYYVIAAPPELSEFVRSFVVTNETQPINATTRAKATGCNYLGWLVEGCCGVSYGDTHQKSLENNYWHISGQIFQRHDIVLRYGGVLKHILAEFTPVGLYRLFGISGSEIVDELVEATRYSSELNQFCDQMIDQATDLPTNDIDSRLDLFIQALLTRVPEALSVPDYLQEGIERLNESMGLEKVANVAQAIGVSERQFSRKFSELVGIPPKHYAKVVQMNRALQAMLQNDRAYFTDIAQGSGFFDQSHLNRVIKEFFDCSPAEFLEGDEQILFTFLGRSRKG